MARVDQRVLMILLARLRELSAWLASGSVKQPVEHAFLMEITPLERSSIKPVVIFKHGSCARMVSQAAHEWTVKCLFFTLQSHTISKQHVYKQNAISKRCQRSMAGHSMPCGPDHRPFTSADGRHAQCGTGGETCFARMPQKGLRSAGPGRSDVCR